MDDWTVYEKLGGALFILFIANPVAWLIIPGLAVMMAFRTTRVILLWFIMICAGLAFTFNWFLL